MAERSKALDWNSSNILTGVPGFESLSLRQNTKAPLRGFFVLVDRQEFESPGTLQGSTNRQDRRFASPLGSNCDRNAIGAFELTKFFAPSPLHAARWKTHYHLGAELFDVQTRDRILLARRSTARDSNRAWFGNRTVRLRAASLTLLSIHSLATQTLLKQGFRGPLLVRHRFENAFRHLVLRCGRNGTGVCGRIDWTLRRNHLFPRHALHTASITTTKHRGL
jgi:hypothetical protein